MALRELSPAAYQEEEDDAQDSPRLSAHALAALQEFLAERREAAPLVEEDDDAGEGPQNVSLVSEDWRLSQFWYDQQTAHTVAEELYHLCKELDSSVACIACPSLYVELKKSFLEAQAHLFEYDERFRRYGSDFTFYDYSLPENLPREHLHSFQVVVADPPYLSEECLQKTVQTMKLLAKDGESRLLLLTGAVQGDRAQRLLGAHPCAFRPSHQNKLGNEFMLFTNYNPLERLGGWEKL